MSIQVSLLKEICETAGTSGFEQRIRETYVRDSVASNKNALADAYVKFFRWASDRIQGRDGIVCFVSNNSFVDQRAFDRRRDAAGNQPSGNGTSFHRPGRSLSLHPRVGRRRLDQGEDSTITSGIARFLARARAIVVFLHRRSRVERSGLLRSSQHSYSQPRSNGQ